MKAVRFNRMMAPYCSGEIAGFPDATADRLVRQGVAVPAEPARVTKVAAAAKAASGADQGDGKAATGAATGATTGAASK